MAEESEKRFEAIMNKLFHTPPKSKTSNQPSGYGVQKLIGRKRPHSSSVGRSLAGNVLGQSGSSSWGASASAQSSACRPWDRGDLYRRLSTFRSITWFAKPQVVSPLECARRGWVNVDMDTIACAACDAHLLFSTPSAWTHQQVEKAAMVFSLKLESGHKLHCPWINNSCAEELAQFPRLSQASLIEEYKKRFFALSQLIALPVIQHVAIDTVRTPELEQFLSESSALGCQELLENSGTEHPVHIPNTSSSVLYYQAQKLISLFGWEPRILRYRVESNDRQKDPVKDGNVIVTSGQKPRVTYFPTTSEVTNPSSEPQFDPSSVVLDCKLCGASVGLWAFSTIPRPLEYIRFVGHTEVTGKNISTHDAQEGSSGNQIHSGTREGIMNSGNTASSSSGFTIAGGPLPALLNYSATISLPVVGQNLRARLPSKTGIKDHQILLESDNATAEETSATTGLDLIVRDPSEVPESDSAVADHPRLGAEEFSSSTSEDIASSGKVGKIGDNQKVSSFDKPKEFDPIRQHRHFCPWIMLTGKVAPGWQQTLSALEGHKEHSSTVIEVDDPVESVKHLFTSPNEKRSKISE